RQYRLLYWHHYRCRGTEAYPEHRSGHKTDHRKCNRAGDKAFWLNRTRPSEDSGGKTVKNDQKRFISESPAGRNGGKTPGMDDATGGTLPARLHQAAGQ